MARRKRYSTSGSMVAALPDKKATWTGFGQLFGKLAESNQSKERIKPHELTFILSTLSTLVQNGVSLPHALETLSREESLAKHRDVLDALQHKIEAGVPFSTAISQFPHLCDRLTVNRIRLGERSGTLAETLEKLSASRNKTAELRSQIAKKLAYPILLVVMGSGLLTFLLLYVVPVFEETYNNAGVPLPFLTQVLIGVGALVRQFGIVIVATLVTAIYAMKQLRKNDDFALRLDLAMIRMPILGAWFRDMAVLQLMEVLQNLMEAGYTLAEALRETADSVGNRAVKQEVCNLQRAVQRGERFSRELERHDGMFPPIVNQLVIVGESTGQLTRATNDICDYLRKEIERKTSLMVGALEPILTIGLAIAIAVVLLAIYLPMFDMVNTMG